MEKLFWIGFIGAALAGIYALLQTKKRGDLRAAADEEGAVLLRRDRKDEKDRERDPGRRKRLSEASV